MKRSDICPSCGAFLRYKEADEYGMWSGEWVCKRCKYTRMEGSPKNPFKLFKNKKRRKLND